VASPIDKHQLPIGQPEFPKLIQQTHHAIKFVLENMPKAITKILSKQKHMRLTHTKTVKIRSKQKEIISFQNRKRNTLVKITIGTMYKTIEGCGLKSNLILT